MAKKPTAKIQPLLGVGSQRIIGYIAHDLAPQVRASSGLASALLVLYGAKLEEAERNTERLGNSCSTDGGAAYARQ